MSAALFEADPGRRRGFRRALGLSVAAHAAVVAVLIVQPGFPKRSLMLPSVVTVELVAAPPGPRPTPAPAPAPAARPTPRKILLPARPTRQVEPVPRAVAPPPEPKPTEEEDYEDLLEKLRADAGEQRPERVEMARRTPTPTPPPSPQVQPTVRPAPQATAGAPGPGRPAPPEVVAWLRDARVHVRREWVLAPGFRLQALETHVRVELDAEGHVRGEPEVTQRSGNPWYDESVVRAIQKASPLPAPPEAGEWPFVFRPEDY